MHEMQFFIITPSRNFGYNEFFKHTISKIQRCAFTVQLSVCIYTFVHFEVWIISGSSDRATTIRFPVAEGIFLILTKRNNFDLGVMVDGESIKITIKMTHTLLSRFCVLHIYCLVHHS